MAKGRTVGHKNSMATRAGTRGVATRGGKADAKGKDNGNGVDNQRSTSANNDDKTPALASNANNGIPRTELRGPPIMRFPPEVLSRIFSFLKEPLVKPDGEVWKRRPDGSEHEWSDPYWDSRRWQRVRLVCKRWFDVVQACGSLWDTLSVFERELRGVCPAGLDKENPMQSAWAKAKYPLTVSLDENDCGPFLPLLLAQGPRIRRLVLHLDLKWSQDELDALAQAELPNLQVMFLRCQPIEPVRQIFRGHFPSLTALTIRTHGKYPVLRCEQLRTLTIENTRYKLSGLRALLDLVQGSPLLEDIAFRDVWMPWLEPEDIEALRRGRAAIPKHRHITLRNVEHATELLDLLSAMGFLEDVDLGLEWHDERFPGFVLPDNPLRWAFEGPFTVARMVLSSTLEIFVSSGTSELRVELARRHHWEKVNDWLFGLAELCRKVQSLWIEDSRKCNLQPCLLTHARAVKQLVVTLSHQYEANWFAKTLVPKKRRTKSQRPYYTARFRQLEELYLVDPLEDMCRKIVGALRVREQKTGLRLKRLHVRLNETIWNADKIVAEWQGCRNELGELVDEFEVGFGEDVAIPSHPSEFRV